LSWLYLDISIERNLEQWDFNAGKSYVVYFTGKCQSTSIKSCQGFVINTYCEGSRSHKQLHFELYYICSFLKNNNFNVVSNIFSLKKVKNRQTPKPHNKMYVLAQNETTAVLVCTIW